MKPKRRFLRFIGWAFLFLLFLVAAAVIVGTQIYSDYEKRAAQFDLSKMGEVSQRSMVYDVNGELYSYFQGENRLVVPLDRVSGWFIQALLAREDSRFWEHRGVDYFGIARALVTNLVSNDVRQGASTLTQQLARNALDLGGRNYDRKALEAVLSQRIERVFSKKEILELYVNRIYFGSGFYGIETASRGYFGKPASELTLSESAVLAGLIRSPNRFSPRNDLAAALGERNTVLDRMVELNMITPADAAAAKVTKLAINHLQPFRNQQDYVMDAVGRDLEDILNPEVIALGGLKIYTTIDPQLQRLAMAAADRQLTKIEESKGYPHPKKSEYQPGDENAVEKPTEYIQAALVAVDNRTGAVRAIVGGRDYNQSKYHRAILSKRQIGSTFKPFVYAAAFQRGLMPGSLISDDKIEPSDFRTVANNWSPANSDGDYMGLQPAAVGLIKSRNTMTVRVGEFAGLPTVHALANKVGIGASMLDLPVSYLGAFETTLKDLTAAYTTFPNFGIYRKAYLIARVDDAEGNILYQVDTGEKRVLPAENAWMTSCILQQVMKTGTAAKAAQLGWKKTAAGKTGTTNDFHDAWFVGYTSSLTCGVWVGMDKPQTIMEKGYGSALALPIWVDFMNQVPEKMYPAASFEPPFQVTKVRLCSSSGARATSQCEQLHLGYEVALPAQRVPAGTCPLHPEPAPVYTYETPTYQSPTALAPAPVRPSAPVTTAVPSSPVDSRTRVATMPPTPPTRVETIAGSSGDSRSLQVDLGGPSISGQREPQTVSRPRVERTARGLRIYPGIENTQQAEVEPRAQRREPVRVLRAIPVEPADRERIAREEEGVRVYRAEPVYRARPIPGRIIRVMPVDE